MKNKTDRIGPEKLFKEYIQEDGRELNDIITNYLQENNPFSIIRIGNTENYILNTLYDGKMIQSRYHFESLHNVAGVFPKDLNFYKNEFLHENIKSISNADIVGWVAVTQPIPNPKFSQDLLKDKICFSEIRVLDAPFILTECETPWTTYLKGKKVLVVSSMKSTIFKQWKNREKVWGKDLDKILPFELVDVIRSPHPPHIEGGSLFVGDDELKTWIDVKNYLESEIDNYDYDVLMAGCGALAPSLANHAKNRGKIGITMCSGIQLLFGISGKRWSLNKGFTHFHKCVNENWCYPISEDIPSNKKIIENLEGLCYWE